MEGDESLPNFFLFFLQSRYISTDKKSFENPHVPIQITAIPIKKY